MGTLISAALYLHAEETGHEVQFKEEWIYDHCARQPHLPAESGYKVTLRGNTRFQAAQAWLEYPNGDRYVQTLGPIATRENLETLECNRTIGRPRKLHPACK